MEIVVREYGSDDIAGFTGCIEGLQAYIAAMDSLGRTRQPKDFDVGAYVFHTLEQVRKHSGVIFVADIGKDIVGCIVGKLDPHTSLDDLEGYPLSKPDGKILELYVDPRYRGQGVGALLMQRMEEYFRQKGCTAVHIDCFAPNVDAHSFYEKVGYRDRLHSLIKVL